MSAKELIMKALKELGCQCQYNDSGYYQFIYQGEVFLLGVKEETSWCMMCTPLKGLVQFIGSATQLDCFKYAVNRVNARHPCSAIFYIDYDHKELCYYIKCDFPLYSDFPNVTRFVTDWLCDFFQVEHDLTMTYNGVLSQSLNDK